MLRDLPEEVEGWASAVEEDLVQGLALAKVLGEG